MTTRRILVPTDFAENDGKVVELASELAKESDAELLLLHVVSDPEKEVYGESSGEGKDRAAWALWKVAQAEIEGRLGALLQSHGSGPEMSRTLCAFGDPATRIAEVVASENVDLVVLSGRRRKSLLQGTHLGSVAYQVVRSTPCDVLIVR